MKKSVFSITTFVLMFCFTVLIATSCKSDPKADKEEIVEEVVDSTLIVEEVVKEAPKPKKKKKKKKPKTSAAAIEKPEVKDYTTRPGVPAFSGSEAQDYVNTYEAYIDEYRRAVASKDMDAFKKLDETSSRLSKKATSLMSKLPGEEIQKLSDYMQLKLKQVNELSKKLQ